MPRATTKYQFEWKVFDWAQSFSNNLTGNVHYAFLIIFTENGLPKRIIFGDRPEWHDHQEFETMRRDASSWFLHDPFDGPVYTYLKWQNVQRQVMERLIGAKFEPNDFVSNDKTIEYPSSWGVMF